MFRDPKKKKILRREFVVALLGIVIFVGGVVESAKADEIKKTATARVVIFMDEGCPIARYHTRTLRLLHDEFSSQGVVFEGVFPNAGATTESIAKFTKKFEIPFKTGIDKSQSLAKKLKAKVVPEAFVFDAENQLVYRGRIDDRFPAVGRRRPVTRSHDLRDVLAAVVDGNAPKTTSTDVVGCAITFTNTRLSPKSD